MSFATFNQVPSPNILNKNTGAGKIGLVGGQKVQDIFDQIIVTPERFGAAGDGDDDTPYFAAAEAYLSNLGGGILWLDPNKEYSVGSAVTLGTLGKEVFLASHSKNGATIKALSDFTGGLIIVRAGGCLGLNFTGFNLNTVGHHAIQIGTPEVTNPLVRIERILNNGGFYDLIKTTYEYDNGVFDLITSNVAVGHSVIDMNTSGSYAPAASPQFTRLSLRNPDSTRSVGQNKKYGIKLGSSQGAVVSGLISNFDLGFYSLGLNKQLDLKNLEVFDLRSTSLNNLWESEWAPNQSIGTGVYRRPTNANVNGHFYVSTRGGSTGSIEQTWSTVDGGVVTDGEVEWTEVGESVQISLSNDQQVTISNCETQAGIVALKNRSNANTIIQSSRFVGEHCALLNTSGNPCELIAQNNLFGGDILIGTLMQFTGSHNLIIGDTVNDVPNHENGHYTTLNQSFKSGKGVDFSHTNRDGATTQVFDDFAKGVWTPTVTANANCSSPVITTARYIKFADFVRCGIKGTVTVTAASTVTNFKFTLPFNMENVSTSTPSGVVYINWGVVGMGCISDWSAGNDTEVGVLVPAVFVGAPGTYSFTGSFDYVPA